MQAYNACNNGQDSYRREGFSALSIWQRVASDLSGFGDRSDGDRWDGAQAPGSRCEDLARVCMAHPTVSEVGNWQIVWIPSL